MTTFGPYTPIRQSGNLYFVSGQVGVDPQTKEASSDVAEQTRQALTNLTSVLAGAQLEMNDIIKTTVFISDMDNFTAINTVYETFFDAPRPARSAIGVKELPRVAGETPVLVEIEAVAFREEVKRV